METAGNEIHKVCNNKNNNNNHYHDIKVVNFIVYDNDFYTQ